jgi:hypothetical protein
VDVLSYCLNAVFENLAEVRQLSLHLSLVGYSFGCVEFLLSELTLHEVDLLIVIRF